MSSFLKKIGIFILLAILASGAFSQENCNLAAPPKASGVTSDHGIIFFIYPNLISKKYSGCQTVWDEKGNIWFFLKFTSGDLIQYIAYDQQHKKIFRECKYDKKELISKNEKSCPAYEDIKKGFESIPKEDEPKIPVERDLRKK